METVPPVVGVHVIVVGSPALIMKPGSRVKGLGLSPCAVAKARMEVATHNSERRMFKRQYNFLYKQEIKCGNVKERLEDDESNERYRYEMLTELRKKTRLHELGKLHRCNHVEAAESVPSIRGIIGLVSSHEVQIRLTCSLLADGRYFGLTGLPHGS